MGDISSVSAGGSIGSVTAFHDITGAVTAGGGGIGFIEMGPGYSREVVHRDDLVLLTQRVVGSGGRGRRSERLDVPGPGYERRHILSLSPFRSLIKDYFLICESYYQAIRSSTPSQIEALDMGRRGLHNEASEVLRARLAGKIETDVDTSRRLFTLICALHWRG